MLGELPFSQKALARVLLKIPFSLRPLMILFASWYTIHPIHRNKRNRSNYDFACLHELFLKKEIKHFK